MGLALLGRHEDVAHARLEFANGCIANLTASRISQAPDRGMKIWSAAGHAVIDFVNRTVSVTQPSAAVCSGQLDVESLSPVERDQLKQTLYAEHLPTRQINMEARNPLVDELSDFKSSIRSGNKPRVTGEQARDAPGGCRSNSAANQCARLEWGSCWPDRPPTICQAGHLARPALAHTG